MDSFVLQLIDQLVLVLVSGAGWFKNTWTASFFGTDLRFKGINRPKRSVRQRSLGSCLILLNKTEKREVTGQEVAF